MDFLSSDIDLVRVLIASILTMLLGWIWYSPLLFGKQWMRFTGMNKENPGVGEAMKGLFFGLLVQIISIYILAMIFGFLNPPSLEESFIYGVLIWLGIQAPIYLGAVLWEKKSPYLFVINALYALVAMMIIVAVLTKGSAW